MKTTSISWQYLSGIYTSDGSLVLGFRLSSGITATFKVSSKSNTNTLNMVSTFLNEKGFNATLDLGSGGRAPTIRVQGPDQVLRLLEMFQKETNVSNIQTPIIGPKALGLKVAIHILRNRKSWSKELQETWVKAYREKTSANASVASEFQLIRASYDCTMGLIEKAIKDETLIVSSDYVVGLTDGDGGFHVTFSDRLKDRKIEVQIGANHTTSDDAWLTSYVWSYALGVTRKPTISKTKAACSNKMNNLNEHQKVVEFFKKHPLLGDYRQQQFEIYVYTFEFKGQQLTRQPIKLIELIEKVYKFEASKGRERFRTLDEMKELVKKYYSID